VWSSTPPALPTPSDSALPCPSVARTRRPCIGTAGRWRACYSGPHRCAGRTAARLCRGQSAASPCMVVTGEEHARVHCRNAARRTNRLLGSDAPPAVGSAAPCAGRGALRSLAGVARAPAEKSHQPRTCLQASMDIAGRKKLCSCTMTGRALHDLSCYRKVKLIVCQQLREHGLPSSAW